MARRVPEPPPIEPRQFRSPEEIDTAIAKLRRRIDELEKLDVGAAATQHTAAADMAASNVREAIREIFGSNSPEFNEHGNLEIWVGAIRFGMSPGEIARGIELGRRQALGVVNGLIKRLEEKRADPSGDDTPPVPWVTLQRRNLHPRIFEVSRDLFMDGHTWDAVFAAAKALINYVKDRSNRHDLDGAPLMTTVFSKKDPILAFNGLANQTDLDEQEGMMHLFEGAVLAIRNPGGHSFPEGPEQRAIEYISFLSLLAYKLQDAKRRK